MKPIVFAMIAAVVVAISTVASPAFANETDQFTLPTDKPFADMGRYFSQQHYKVLKKTVDKMNGKIDEALKIVNPKERQGRLDFLHSQRNVADTFAGAFAPGFFDMMDIEDTLRAGKLKKQYPGQLTVYKTIGWIYADVHLPIDPRKLVLLFQSSTVKVYGSYVGVDKLSHFHDLGHIYYSDYLSLRQEGKSDDDATRIIVERFAYGPISERAVIGNFATGVMSNGDLAANYCGFKFYRNLTEPVKLKGKMAPPMLVRDGEHWKINTQVTPDSDFFAVYVSDHWNEALNPCIYEWGMRGPIANHLKKNADKILTFYADKNGQKHTREWFEDKALELTTYYGEDYGGSGISDDMITIANCCFSTPTPKYEVTKR